MSSQGPNSGGTFADGGEVVGLQWTNPGNAAASDNSYATKICSTSGSSSNTLQATNFGFSIPSGATINGITVEIERKSNRGSPTLVDASVKLIKGGTVSGTDKASASTWPTADAYATYGSSSDLWGLTLTDSDVNASNFGVSLRVKQSPTGGKLTATANVDHIRITVTYTGGGGGSQQPVSQSRTMQPFLAQ